MRRALGVGAAIVAVAALVGCGGGSSTTDSTQPAPERFRLFRIPSASMLPTYRVGQRVVLDTRAYAGGRSPRRGDVVAFHVPAGSFSPTSTCPVRRAPDEACPRAGRRPQTAIYLKRVVAVAGDRVSVRGNRTYLNGRRRREPFVRVRPCTDICELPRAVVVPRGQVFVLGDNRGQSEDSRVFGPIRLAWIVGRT